MRCTMPVKHRALPADLDRNRAEAREHNLKNIDVNLGRNQFTVITASPAAGKSSLAFDILFAEGQRPLSRITQRLCAAIRASRIPPGCPMRSLAYHPPSRFEQRTSRGGHKSTVATLTEIYHFLRLLYVKLGVQYCPTCNATIEPQSADAIAARVLKDYRGQKITLLAPTDRSAQGAIHGAGQVGSRQGLRRTTGRRVVAADGEMAAARSIHRTQYRTTRGHVDRQREKRGRASRRSGGCAGTWAAASCMSPVPCAIPSPFPRLVPPPNPALIPMARPLYESGLPKPAPISRSKPQPSPRSTPRPLLIP